MEKAREALSVKEGESAMVSRIPVLPHRVRFAHSFYEGFVLRGIRVDRVEPGLVACTFKVPPRLTDVTGNLSSGAIANLVDEIGGAVVQPSGPRITVSVDMSIAYLSTAKVDDELEIISRALGHKGGYSGTSVLLRNKRTGELIAEGRHSLFAKL
ncbi:uncharacterized protein LOC143879954 isoform X2 [Tasmannia lanceolata]|uniref:uncharacterized protein LOC143879954 isoform X2 n=1 Tax=Tasmannia lanceolata TaxID=3420 RepID=UPI004063A693